MANRPRYQTIEVLDADGVPRYIGVQRAGESFLRMAWEYRDVVDNRLMFWLRLLSVPPKSRVLLGRGVQLTAREAWAFPAASVSVATPDRHPFRPLLRLTMLLDDLSDFLRRHLPQPHLRRLWRPDIGTQILFAKGDKRFRIPKGGATRTPYYHDTSYHPALNPESVLAVGVNGWNWVDQVSEYVTFDLDSLLNHGDGLRPEQLAEIVEKIKAVPEAEIVRSKSGLGYHVRLFFDPHPSADTHDDHAHNGRRALAWLGKRIDTPLEAAVDMCGAIGWIWHQKTAPNGFELIKEAV